MREVNSSHGTRVGKVTLVCVVVFHLAAEFLYFGGVSLSEIAPAAVSLLGGCFLHQVWVMHVGSTY